jgi:type I restriction enzyme M protein
VSGADPDGRYRDVPWLDRVVSRADVAARDWAFYPGRNVGMAPGHMVDDEEFRTKLEALQEELEALNIKATTLQARIVENAADLLA